MKGWILLIVAITVVIAPLYAGILDVFNLGVTDLQESRWEQSVMHFLQAAELDRNHPLSVVSLYNAANVEFLVNHNPGKATELFQQVVDKSPQSVWAAESWRRMAECSESLGNDSQAVDYYFEALQIGSNMRDQLGDPWTSEVSLAAANFLTKLGNQEKAITYYDKLRQQITVGEPAAQVRFALAEAYESIGKTNEATLCYRDIAESYPQTNTARGLNSKRDLVTKELDYDWTVFDLYQQSSGRMRAGNRTEAMNLCQQILDNYPNSGISPRAQVRLYMLSTYSTGDFKKGIEDLVEFLLQHPDWNGNEETRNAIQQWQNLAESVEQTKQHPEDLELYNGLGYQLFQLRAFDLAIPYFEHVLSKEPNNSSANMGIGYVLNASGRTQEAVPHFEAVLASDPQDGTMLNILGYAYLQARNFDKAREMFRRYIESDTTDANAYDSMGECLFNEGKYDESARFYQKALSVDSTFSNSRFMLGEVYKASGDTTKAIIAYQHFLETDLGGRLAELARASLDSLTTAPK